MLNYLREKLTTQKIYWFVLQNKKKILIGGLVICTIQLAYYLIKRRRDSNNQDNKKQIQKKQLDYTRDNLESQVGIIKFEEENPIRGKSKELINIFLGKLKKDQILSNYFKPQHLIENSNFANKLQKYMFVSMGGPYIDISQINVRQKHQNLNITRKEFDRWVKLWKQCEQQLKIQGKDIWSDLYQHIFNQ